MRAITLAFLLILETICSPHRPVAAEHFRLGHYVGDDMFAVDLLRLALKEYGGNHTLEIVPQSQGQRRLLRSIADGTADFDIYYSGYDKEREAELRMVKIPLTRGLLGYRLLAIRQDRHDLFANVSTLADLRGKFSFGSGTDWPDTKILLSAGLNVVSAADGNLWPMLVRGRFDAFPRGLNEVMEQFETHQNGDPDIPLMLNRHIMLAYRFDHFFFLDRRNERKAQIIENGLIKAYQTGSFMTYFNNAPWVRRVFDELKQHQRHVIYLENPLLGDTVRNLPEIYWHDLDQNK